MAKLDKVKEEIGWIKAVFSIVLVTDLSLIAWLIQHYDDGRPLLLGGCLILIVSLAIFLLFLNRSAFQMIKEIEKL